MQVVRIDVALRLVALGDTERGGDQRGPIGPLARVLAVADGHLRAVEDDGVAFVVRFVVKLKAEVHLGLAVFGDGERACGRVQDGLGEGDGGGVDVII